MNPKVLLLAFTGLSTVGLMAQENRFYIPAEIQKAYEKNTRSYDAGLV